jgi:predicted transcriptional regulator
VNEQSLLEYVRARLPAPSEREALEVIAAGASVPYHTLLKIAKGETHDPRVSTIDSLIRYFREREAA